jgi:cytidyltransferase-like protein
MLKKIGIYGGSFDPIHYGHLILAREAREALDLETVIFVPAAMSPFKRRAAAASGDIRLKMLHAAIEGEEDLHRRLRAAPAAPIVDDRYGVGNWETRNRLRDLSPDRRRQRGEFGSLATVRRFKGNGAFCSPRPHGLTKAVQLPDRAPEDRHLSHGHQKESCARTIDPLSRTASGARNY